MMSKSDASVVIRVMTLDDYDQVIDLFKNTQGVSVREADSKAATERYLHRNPGLSFVAISQGKIVGCVMSGHDGRRGYLQHLVVVDECRHQGVGSQLFHCCLKCLAELGIDKTHIFVFKDNVANAFWCRHGWQLREDINMYSYNGSDNPNI